MTTPDWLRARIAFTHAERGGSWCHSGGWLAFQVVGLIGPAESNYGYPHVVGAQYWEDGTISMATRCIFCGATQKEES